MRQVGTRIKRRRVDFASVKADRARFDAMVDDLRQSGGRWTPISRWLTTDSASPVRDGTSGDIDAAFSASNFEARFATMEKLLMAWIGSGQMRPVAEPELSDYGSVLADSDLLGLWQGNVADPSVRQELINTDLGTLLDVTLLYAFAGGAAKSRTMLLEVGGGYGRLAEATMNVFGPSVCHVLVDAVPGSLYYAAAYLRSAVPGARVGSYYDGDPFDLERFDAYVIPTWHFERLNTRTYDVLVNIESFQEMSQQLVDAYLDLFDRRSHEGSIFYVSNARDHLFRGAWRFPDAWKPMLCANTPRSWTRDHPTQIFEKTGASYGAATRIAEALHHRGLPEVDPNKLAANVGLRRLAPAVARMALSSFARRAARAFGRE